MPWQAGGEADKPAHLYPALSTSTIEDRIAQCELVDISYRAQLNNNGEIYAIECVVSVNISTTIN